MAKYKYWPYENLHTYVCCVYWREEKRGAHTHPTKVGKMQCNAEPSEIRRETWTANAGASHENKIKSSQLGQETVATTANCMADICSQ